MAVKSAERVLRVFEHLSNHPNGLTAKEIGDQLGWAASSTFELLKTLTDSDYLTVDEVRRYALGPRLIQLGISASASLDVTKLAGPILRRLMDTLNETVFMSVLSGEEIIYVAKVNSTNTISTNANVGSRKPLYCTGLGKAFLAFMARDQSDALLERLSFQPLTPNTVTAPDALRSQLEQFRLQGYAVDDGEIEEGLWCAAVPIFNAEHRMVAAVSVSGPKARMLPKLELVTETILWAGTALSRKCGYFR